MELEVESTMKGCRSVTRTVRLVAGQPWVETTNVVDKLPLLDKDGIHFGFGFNVPQGVTKVDIPWGVMEMEKDQWPQANRNWIALQRWLDVSNDTHGVTWCALDAPLFEYGDRTANISLGWGGQGPWLTKLEPSSTVYSWAMNNHWHTNFPLTQDGPVAFRYRIHPHGGYDAVAANRFGLEQAQPLVHVTADKNPDVKPVVAVDNRARVRHRAEIHGERQRDDCPFAFRVGQGRDCGFGLPGPPSVVRVALPARGAARASRGGDADDETLRHGHVETRFLTTGAWEASVDSVRQRAVGASVRG